MNDTTNLDKSLTEAIKQFQNGDDTAFQAVYDNSVRYVNYSILMSLQDKGLAEDILQETYLEVYKNLRSLKEPEAFKKWAVVIAHNKISRYYRNNKDSVFSSEEEMDSVIGNEEEENADMLPEDALDNQETQRLILDIINGLPEIQRETVISFYYNQMSISEISDALGVPENTTKTNLSRGRKKIKDGVLELEKKHGTKLYALPLMAVISGIFAKESMACELPADGLALVESESGAVSASGAVKDAVIKGAAATAAKTTAIKWALIAAAGLVVVGAGAGVALSINSQKKQEAAAAAEAVMEEMAEEKDKEEEANAAGNDSDNGGSETDEEPSADTKEDSTEDAAASTEEAGSEEPEEDIDYNEEYYRERMKDVTSEEIAKIYVDDFDDDGVNGAFVVTVPDGTDMEWMQEDFEGAFVPSSFYYLEKDEVTEIYVDDPKYSAYLNLIETDSGEKILSVGTQNEYAPSRNYDDTLYVVRDHKPICLGTTDGASFYSDGKLQSGKTMVGGEGMYGLITVYTIEDDKLVAGEQYEMEDW